MEVYISPFRGAITNDLRLSGFAQTVNQSFDFNGESDLDLEYGMTLAAPQQVTLYQAGDIPEGTIFEIYYYFEK